MVESTSAQHPVSKSPPQSSGNEAETDQKKSSYVGVIYVHGMGSQRRYEETSRLIDAIDDYLQNSYHQFNEAKGWIRRIKPRSEPSRTDPDQNVTYIRTEFLDKNGHDGQPGDHKEVRYYEVYWAPVMAGHGSPWGIVKWMLAQVLRPLQTLFSPWRERQRLRRAALVSLREHPDRWPGGVSVEDFDRLVEAYDSFEGLDARRDYPAGKFKQFRAYLEKRNQKDADAANRQSALTKAWFSGYLREELLNLFLLISLAVALLLAACGAIASILLLLEFLSGSAFLTQSKIPFIREFFGGLKPTWSMAVAVAAFVFLGLLGKFLTNFMGDVQAWATYEETDEKHQRRAKVIERGVDVITHVLNDERCERAIVVSHSLGTAIAHDTLLAIAGANRAHNRSDPISGPVALDKIEHFVTIASPIDKIAYFFESYRSDYHRYKRVVEELRGDIGDVPFSRNKRKPYVHWMNFWDEGDIIGGALQTPANRQRLSHRVDNYRVANLRFPAPGASHSAYFKNRIVIAYLFEMIYRAKYSFNRLPLVEGKGYDYESVYQGPGEKPGSGRVYFAAALAIPWLVLAGLAMYVFEAPAVAGYVAFGLAGLALLVLVAGYLYSRAQGQKSPL